MRDDPGMVGAVFPPETAGAGADENDIARVQCDSFPLQRVLKVAGRDRGMTRKGINLLERGDVDQPGRISSQRRPLR